MLSKVLKYTFIIIGCILVIKGFLHDNNIFTLIGLFVVIGTFGIQIYGLKIIKK